MNQLLSFPWILFLLYNSLNFVVLLYIMFSKFVFFYLGLLYISITSIYVLYIIHIINQMGHTFDSIQTKLIRNYQTKYVHTNTRNFQWLCLVTNYSSDNYLITWCQIKELSIYRTYFTLCPFQIFQLSYTSVLQFCLVILCYTVLGVQTNWANKILLDVPIGTFFLQIFKQNILVEVFFLFLLIKL